MLPRRSTRTGRSTSPHFSCLGRDRVDEVCGDGVHPCQLLIDAAETFAKTHDIIDRIARSLGNRFDEMRHATRGDGRFVDGLGNMRNLSGLPGDLFNHRLGRRMEGGSSTPLHLVETITRADLEKLVEDLIKRTLDPCKKALADAGVKASDISEVVLVGGMLC